MTGAGNDSRITQLLYRGGAPLTNSGGVPWTAAYIDTITEPTADLRSNIAAEARAKIVYERLINITDDPDIRDTLGFLMTREIAHQKSFEKALHSIQPNFPQGKLPGKPEFASVYFRMQSDDPAIRGPWNEGTEWEFVAAEPAVDGGNGFLTFLRTTKRSSPRWPFIPCLTHPPTRRLVPIWAWAPRFSISDWLVAGANALELLKGEQDDEPKRTSFELAARRTCHVKASRNDAEGAVVVLAALSRLDSAH